MLPDGGGAPIALADPDTLALPAPYELLCPVEPPEVWCAGVTYERSRDARIEESSAKDAYALVYEAERPELFDDWDAALAVRLRILDRGEVAFAGETSTARMKRSFGELVGWLLRDNPVPPGSVLLTGTGLVPPDDFTLEPGMRVEIHVPGIGTLVNEVALASDLL